MIICALAVLFPVVWDLCQDFLFWLFLTISQQLLPFFCLKLHPSCSFLQLHGSGVILRFWSLIPRRLNFQAMKRHLSENPCSVSSGVCCSVKSGTNSPETSDLPKWVKTDNWNLFPKI